MFLEGIPFTLFITFRLFNIASLVLILKASAEFKLSSSFIEVSVGLVIREVLLLK